MEGSERDGKPGRQLPDGLDVNADNRNNEAANDFDVWTWPHPMVVTVGFGPAEALRGLEKDRDWIAEALGLATG